MQINNNYVHQGIISDCCLTGFSRAAYILAEPETGKTQREYLSSNFHDDYGG